jgi:hypothetical protein
MADVDKKWVDLAREIMGKQADDESVYAAARKLQITHDRASHRKEELAQGYPTPSTPDKRLPEVVRDEIKKHSNVIPADSKGMPVLKTAGGKTSTGNSLRKAGAKLVELFALGPDGVKSSEESVETGDDE